MRDLIDILQKIKENEKLLKAAVVVLVITAAVLFYFGNGKSDTISLKDAESGEKTEAEHNFSENNKGKVYVDVAGEVKTPGVYQVNSGSRIFEVIQKAGGLTDKADTGTINQADKVKDGDKIIVPGKGSKTAAGDQIQAAGGGGTRLEGTGGNLSPLININSADSTELQKIPGVGPATAEKIIQYRMQNGSYKKTEDLKNVSGIGDKIYEKMKSMITV